MKQTVSSHKQIDVLINKRDGEDNDKLKGGQTNGRASKQNDKQTDTQKDGQRNR